MGTMTGALPLSGFGSKVAAKTKVDYQNTPEGLLVQRAQAGDEAAFREIVERYQSKVFSIIHGIVRQRNDVEDIAQQVFAKIYLSVRNFDFRSSLITWIYKITVNECFDYLRKRKVRKLVYESDLSEDEVRRVENSEPSVDRTAPADSSLAQRDYVLKLLSRVSEEERSLSDDERGGGLFGGRVGRQDRYERKYHQGEALPRAAETGKSCAAPGSRSRFGCRLDGKAIKCVAGSKLRRRPSSEWYPKAGADLLRVVGTC